MKKTDQIILLPISFNFVDRIIGYRLYCRTTDVRLFTNRTLVHSLIRHFVHHPVQWGAPTFSLGGVVGVFAGVIVSVIESVGDYYACARLAAVRIPPVDAVNRGIAIEGLGSIISAIFGSGCGLTSYRLVICIPL